MTCGRPFSGGVEVGTELIRVACSDTAEEWDRKCEEARRRRGVGADGGPASTESAPSPNPPAAPPAPAGTPESAADSTPPAAEIHHVSADPSKTPAKPLNRTSVGTEAARVAPEKPVPFEGGQWGKCRSCGAEIVWAPHHNDPSRTHPYDPSGTSHFKSCPQAASWRKRGPKKFKPTQPELAPGQHTL